MRFRIQTKGYSFQLKSGQKINLFFYHGSRHAENDHHHRRIDIGKNLIFQVTIDLERPFKFSKIPVSDPISENIIPSIFKVSSLTVHR